MTCGGPSHRIFGFSPLSAGVAAVGALGVVFAHEFGHFVAARRCGLEVPLVSVSAFGGATFHDYPQNRRDVVLMSVGGSGRQPGGRSGGCFRSCPFSSHSS